jgi:hypothetical protein
MKRRVAMVELIVTCVIGPFFTTKCLQNPSEEYQYPSNALISNTNQRKIYYSKPIIYWMLGIFSAMCAINNFLLHLVCFTQRKKKELRQAIILIIDFLIFIF